MDSTVKMSNLITKNEELEKEVNNLKSMAEEEKERANSAEARLNVILEDHKDSEELQIQLRQVFNRVEVWFLYFLK